MCLGQLQPDAAEQFATPQRKALVNWLTEELQRVVDVRRSTGGQVVLRRLTRYEYNYTMQDLLGVEMDFAKDLPPDSTSADGFQNEGGTLSISPLQFELYLDAARR